MGGVKREYVDLRMKATLLFIKGYELKQIAQILGYDYQVIVTLSNEIVDMVKWYESFIKSKKGVEMIKARDKGDFDSWRMDKPDEWKDVEPIELSDSEREIYIKRLSLH